MQMGELEQQMLTSAVFAARAFFGTRSKREICAQYRKKRDKRRAVAKASRKRNRK